VTCSLASRTLDRATHALQTGQAACLPEIVKLLHTLTRGMDEVSVSDLAEVVQKDTVVLSKVIGAANTFAYNPNGVPISTVTQAIHVIGYERIRTLAISLMLVEHTTRGRAPDEQREATALSLTAGFISQSAAGSRRMIDAEQAFVCGALRNFGHIILSTFMLEEYRDVYADGAAPGSDATFRAIFGLTPLELGRNLLEAYNLPDPILSALQECSEESLQVLNTSPDSQMLALSEFSMCLAKLTFDSSHNAASFAKESAALAERYSHVLPGLGEEISALVAESSERLAAFSRDFKITALPANTLIRMRQRVKRIDPPTPPAPVKAVLTPLSAPRLPRAPVAASNLWELEGRDFSRLIAEPDVTADQILSALMGIAKRGFSTRDCLVFAGAPGVSTFSLVQGSGSFFEGLDKLTEVKREERTALGICVSRCENVLVHHAGDAKIAPYLPAWLRGANAPSAYALLPIADRGMAQGLLMVGWPNQQQVIIPGEQAQIIRRLLGQVCRFLERAPVQPASLAESAK
jgi:HD-like signal output (HDOD) protein